MWDNHQMLDSLANALFAAGRADCALFPQPMGHQFADLSVKGGERQQQRPWRSSGSASPGRHGGSST